MMKNEILNDSDREEAIRLDRRKAYEYDRLKRIFNAPERYRSFDWGFLEREMKAHADVKKHEFDISCRYENQRTRQQLSILSNAKEEQKRAKKRDADVHYYRCALQNPKDTREFIVTNPQWRRGGHSMCTSEPGVGPLSLSSCQIFEGEDVDHKERLHRQRLQQRAWLDQQVAERVEAKEGRLKDMIAYSKDIEKRNTCLEQIAADQDKMRSQKIDDGRHCNQKLMQMKKATDAQRQMNEWEDDKAEICNTLNGTLLAQDPNEAESKTSLFKKIAHLYRCLTDEELAKVRREQKEQLEAKRKYFNDQEVLEKQWEQYQIRIGKELIMKQMQYERLQREVASRRYVHNKEAIELNRLRKKQANIDEHASGISDEFYDCFNRTSR